MHAFDEYGQIKQYFTADEIITDYFRVRFHRYELRRFDIIRKSKYNQLITSFKAQFIQDILDNKLSLTQSNLNGTNKIKSKSYKQLSLELKKLNYLTENEIKEVSNNEIENINLSDKLNTKLSSLSLQIKEDKDEDEKGFQYLLNMPIYSFTEDRIIKLQQQAKDANEQLILINQTLPEQLWLNDLDILKKEIEKYYNKK